jgi:hypothetical protein
VTLNPDLGERVENEMVLKRHQFIYETDFLKYRSIAEILARDPNRQLTAEPDQTPKDPNNDE